MANTVTRSLRVDDELWNEASRRAAADGLVMSGLIRALLEAYTNGQVDPAWLTWDR